jgi:hypothetical protein
LGAHVSQTHKNKIINGEYIDLALLLENTTISEKQEKQIVIIYGVLATRDNTKQIINTISKWTDAFIVYISIYSSMLVITWVVLTYSFEIKVVTFIK